MPNGNYCMNCTKKRAPGELHVSTNGKTIDGWLYYNDCERVPVAHHPAIPIAKNGSFSYSGRLTDVTKNKIHFTIRGHFVSSHLATGVADATGGGRTCRAAPFKARFTNTGPFQP